MNIGGKLGEGFVVFIIGVMVVFSVLMILWGLLAVFKIIFNDIPEKKKKKNAEKPVAAVKEEPIVPIAYEDDTEIVAVITAAIASMLGKSESSFKIKSIRRSSNWNK